MNGSEEIIDSMKKYGWKGDPIDIVLMPDGMYTTIDNTRVVAARSVGIDVMANVHNYDEILLDDNLIRRFTTNKGIPKTWGQAVELRILKQNSSFRKSNPDGSFEIKNIK